MARFLPDVRQNKNKNLLNAYKWQVITWEWWAMELMIVGHLKQVNNEKKNDSNNKIWSCSEFYYRN